MTLISATSSKTAILLVDIQSAFRVPGYFGTERNNKCLENNVQYLIGILRLWNSTRATQDEDFIDIVHIHHHSVNANSPLHPSFVLPDDQTTHGIDPLPCAEVAEGEMVFIKDVNSAFIGTSLEQHLRKRRVRQLLICGITTDHCVSTTVRMAANLRVVDDLKTGQKGTIFLIRDACATFGKGNYPADLIHDVHVESLKGEFAEITTTEEMVRIVVGC